MITSTTTAAQRIAAAREILAQAAADLGVDAIHIAGMATYLHHADLCEMALPAPGEPDESALSRALAHVTTRLAIRAEVNRLEAIARTNLNITTT